MNDHTSAPVFSAREPEQFRPQWVIPRGKDEPPEIVVSPRTYQIAPLTFLQRQAFRAAMARAGAIMPDRAQLTQAVRTALREIQPANLAELLSYVDRAEEFPDDADSQARLAAVEAAVADVPVFAELRANHERALGLMPFLAAQYALRGWEGERLPPFERRRGLVPDQLLELLPEDELQAIGWRAVALMRVSQSAEKNSAPPSPSPETPAPTPEG